MASIHSNDIQDFIVNMLEFTQKPDDIWIGLIRDNSGITIRMFQSTTSKLLGEFQQNL